MFHQQRALRACFTVAGSVLPNGRLARFGVLALAMAGFSGAAYAANPNPGNPADLDTTADVEILPMITITEDGFNLDFGKITKPSSGSQDYIVASVSNGGISTEPFNGGIGDGLAISGHHVGIYTISGEAEASYTLTTGSDGCFLNGDSTGNLQLISIGTDVSLSPTLNDTLNVGGRLRVSSSATTGVSYTCEYFLRAEY